MDAPAETIERAGTEKLKLLERLTKYKVQPRWNFDWNNGNGLPVLVTRREFDVMAKARKLRGITTNDGQKYGTTAEGQVVYCETTDEGLDRTRQYLANTLLKELPTLTSQIIVRRGER